MTEFDPILHDEEYFAKRSVPVMLTYLHPFRIVNSTASPAWDVSIKHVNQQSWDYAALQEMVGGIEVGLTSPYHLVVARDGALALPIIPELGKDQKAVEFFNRCLAAFLVGGIYCEAVTLDGLDFGSIFDWKYIQSMGQGMAAPNRIHHQFRMRKSSPLESIALMNPRTVEFDDLVRAMAIGREVLSKVPEVSGEFLLKGATGFARRDWGTALANLWIVVEQLSSHLWTDHIVNPDKGKAEIPGRSKQLQDYRTWTTGVRLEVLYQREVFAAESLAMLTEARKARNDLAHRGLHPSASAAKAVWGGVMALLQAAAPNKPIPLVSLSIEDHTLSDPFEPREPIKLQPQYWMEIPKLPGEQEFEQLRAIFRANKRHKLPNDDGN